MKLYHATYAKTLASIQKNGLKPNMPHNWGVGLYGYDLSDKIFLSFSPAVSEDYLSTSDTYKEDEDIIVLEIDTKDIDLNKCEYDWNNRCECTEDINSVAYEGTITKFRVLTDWKDISGAEIDAMKYGDEDAQRLYWILCDTFDEEVEPFIDVTADTD